MGLIVGNLTYISCTIPNKINRKSGHFVLVKGRPTKCSLVAGICWLVNVAEMLVRFTDSNKLYSGHQISQLRALVLLNYSKNKFVFAFESNIERNTSLSADCERLVALYIVPHL